MKDVFKILKRNRLKILDLEKTSWRLGGKIDWLSDEDFEEKLNREFSGEAKLEKDRDMDTRWKELLQKQ